MPNWQARLLASVARLKRFDIERLLLAFKNALQMKAVSFDATRPIYGVLLWITPAVSYPRSTACKAQQPAKEQ